MDTVWITLLTSLPTSRISIWWISGQVIKSLPCILGSLGRMVDVLLSDPWGTWLASGAPKLAGGCRLGVTCFLHNLENSKGTGWERCCSHKFGSGDSFMYPPSRPFVLIELNALHFALWLWHVLIISGSASVLLKDMWEWINSGSAIKCTYDSCFHLMDTT